MKRRVFVVLLAMASTVLAARSQTSAREQPVGVIEPVPPLASDGGS